MKIWILDWEEIYDHIKIPEVIFKGHFSMNEKMSRSGSPILQASASCCTTA